MPRDNGIPRGTSSSEAGVRLRRSQGRNRARTTRPGARKTIPREPRSRLASGPAAIRKF